MAFSGIYFTEIQKILHNGISSPSLNYGSSNKDSLEVVFPTSANKDSVSDSSSHQTDNSDEYTKPQYPGILDTDLTALTNGQKNFFIITVTILCVLSVFGNLCTLFVNLRRNIRPFFRACLISLAFSDLVNTVFLSTAYLSQFTAEYVQIWSLGEVMCSFVPFATTAAILASSMTLVGIAVDRYYAVMKAVIGFWNPTVISCFVFMLCIWLASIGIACPVFTIYDILPFYILTEQHETDVSGGETTTAAATATAAENVLVSTTKKAVAAAVTLAATTKTSWEINASEENLSYTLVTEQKLVRMCVSDQKDVTLYYVIVFGIIFIPCIGAFIWFNAVIARKIWIRRHSVAITRKATQRDIKNKAMSKTKVNTSSLIELQGQQTTSADQVDCVQPQSRETCNCRSGHTVKSTMPGGTTTTNTGSSYVHSTAAAPSSSNGGPTRNSREARHLRMFTIILLMMAVFVFLRLPAWIFLLMRMYGSYSKPVDWIIFFVFGVMNLASSVLNPLFYTFLTETIKYILSFKAKVAALICGHCARYWCCCFNGRTDDKKTCATATMSNVEEPHFALSCCENFCGYNGFLRATWQCHSAPDIARRMHRQTPVGELENKMQSQDRELAYVNGNDKDEGVDCSDELEIDGGDFEIYNRRIYTIYPASLVSSSMNSK